MLTPKYDESEGRYLIGISNADFVELSGLDSFRYSWYEMRYCVNMTWKSLAMLVQGQVSRQDVAGPVGIAVNVVGKTYESTKDYGWQNVLVNMLNITLMLTVNLGILNLLPDPRAGRRPTGIPDLGSHHTQAGASRKRRHGTLYWTDVLHGTDGVPVI